MAYSYGKDVTLTVDTHALAGEQDGSFEVTGEPIEAYGKADFPTTKRVVGWTDWKADGNILVDTSDAGYQAIRDAALAGTAITLTIDVDGDSLEGSAQITSFKVTGAKKEMATVAFACTGLDALAVPS